MLENKWLTCKEAAEVIGCSDGHVRCMLIENKLVGQRLGGKLWLVDKTSAEQVAKNPMKIGRKRKNEKS